MGLLDRYRKPGGFVQLLQLVETTTPQKREQFLKMIEEEDSRWSDAIHKKMLSMDRIFSWDDNTVGEIMNRVHELTLAVALQGLSKEREAKVFQTFSTGQKRRITELVQNKKPSPAEISTAHSKIIDEVRNMIKQNILRFEKFDPNLTIEENLEEKLGPTNDVKLTVTEDAEASEKLSNQVLMLSQENKKLKSEVRILREKLEQIKKIA